MSAVGERAVAEGMDGHQPGWLDDRPKLNLGKREGFYLPSCIVTQGGFTAWRIFRAIRRLAVTRSVDERGRRQNLRRQLTAPAVAVPLGNSVATPLVGERRRQGAWPPTHTYLEVARVEWFCA